ncbi:MAG: RbsD/FucU domain-containing protein [Opitutales bacterium]
MLKGGILNPGLLHLVGRFRHTNTLVIADRGFPSWPGMETVDLSLVDDIPTVAQVVTALRTVCVIGPAWSAEEVHGANPPAVLKRHLTALDGLDLTFEPHRQFKDRVPDSIGLIRTGDTTQYANVILESA